MIYPVCSLRPDYGHTASSSAAPPPRTRPFSIEACPTSSVPIRLAARASAPSATVDDFIGSLLSDGATALIAVTTSTWRDDARGKYMHVVHAEKNHGSHREGVRPREWGWRPSCWRDDRHLASVLLQLVEHVEQQLVRAATNGLFNQLFDGCAARAAEHGKYHAGSEVPRA